jgi:hypothetical protein
MMTVTWNPVPAPVRTALVKRNIEFTKKLNGSGLLVTPVIVKLRLSV